MNIIPAVFIVTADIEKCIAGFNTQLADLGEDYLCRPKLMYSFDTDISPEQQKNLGATVRNHIRELDIS